ncbi:MAG TPA: dephospho-CoA kinase [Terriglobales bacterium]|nr:dephospho-CoA kinase [Terriglobales bacterium]
MLKLGLTGGIASGKSLVGEMFVQLGAHLIQSDAVAHRLREPGQPVYEKIVAAFGPGILDPDKTINRSKLAEAAFGQPPRVNELNAIVHPAVIAYENQWMEEIAARDPKSIAIVEAALILEANAAGRFDYLIVVTCREDQRIERVAKRLGISKEAAKAEVARRMAAQWPDEKKIQAADFVIDNSGTTEQANRQVQAFYAKLIHPQSGDSQHS